jgi:predicted DNA-binding transcriptional regulator AlpA
MPPLSYRGGNRIAPELDEETTMTNTSDTRRDGDELLTLAEVAAIVRVPVATVRYWRHLSTGPKGFRLGRGVRYWKSDVMAWLEDQSDGSGPHAA